MHHRVRQPPFVVPALSQPGRMNAVTVSRAVGPGRSLALQGQWPWESSRQASLNQHDRGRWRWTGSHYATERACRRVSVCKTGRRNATHFCAATSRTLMPIALIEESL